MKLVLTCEHAGNRIPEEYRYLFKGNPRVLDTHRGYDPGAYDLYKELRGLASYSKAHEESRLLIEINRSLHHPALFSEFTGKLPLEVKNRLIDTYYSPYRKEVYRAIAEFIETGEKVVHLSIHSFTPEMNGIERNADIGLLYDPARKTEKIICKLLKQNLLYNEDSYRIRSNYPYRGTADGFTTSLRRIFDRQYSGIEIEVNQKFSVENKMDPQLISNIFRSVQSILQNE